MRKLRLRRSEKEVFYEIIMSQEVRILKSRCFMRKLRLGRRDEGTGEWRKLHNEELRDLYSSPSIIRIMKARRMRWSGHVARMGRR
jgi:hypothetical protein